MTKDRRIPNQDVIVLLLDNPTAPDVAAAAIADGYVIGFPTDTVYGLGAGLWRPEAIKMLYTLKRRPDDKALPVLLASREDVAPVAIDLSTTALRLMDAFWPGGLTLVVPRNPLVPDAVGLHAAATIAIRAPAHAGLRRVLARTGPLASSSANLSGQAPALDAAGVAALQGDGPRLLALVLDGGAAPPRPPSTVVDLTGPQPVVLRQGAVSAQEIAAVLASERSRPLD